VGWLATPAGTALLDGIWLGDAANSGREADFSGSNRLLESVAVATIIPDRPRTDPDQRSLAHAAPILDKWRRSDQEATDASREV
jgi:hypothetical protein